MRANHTTVTKHYDGDGPTSQAPGCLALVFDVLCFLVFLGIGAIAFWMLQ